MTRLIPPMGAAMLGLLTFGCADVAPTDPLVDSPALETATDRSPSVARAGGFASPLFGLSTGPNGDVLVADAGAGIAVVQGSGSALEVALPGVTDLAPLGRGTMWATTGAGADPTMNTGQALYRVSNGAVRLIADLFAFEEANDPDGGGVPDSNPFDVASLGGQSALVADAGGNDLLRVDNTGAIEVVAVFPDELVSTANVQALVGCPNPSPLCSLPPMIPAEAVPTSVAVGPDGYFYVGELKGFPAPTNESNVWKVAPGASAAQCGTSPECVKVFDGGFTSIIDLAFDADGNLLVVELDEQSWFAVEVLGGGVGGTVNACDVTTMSCTEIASSVPIITAVTVGKRGAIWATRNALVPGQAEVFQLP